MKVEWIRMKEEWHNWLDPKHGKLYVVKEAILVHEQQVLLQVRKTEIELVKCQMHVTLQSYNASYQCFSHDREVQQEKATQNLEYQEA